MDLLLIGARFLLCGVFAVAGIGKLLDLPGSRQAMRDFGLPPAAAQAAGVGLPIAELLIAAALLIAPTVWWGALAGLALLVVFIGGMVYQLARGRTPNCHCFGQLHSAPVGPATLIRNGVLALVAGLLVAQGANAPVPGLLDSLGVRALGGALLLVAGVVLGLAVAALGWMVLNLLRQNGRLLLRIEALEKHLGIEPAPVAEAAESLRGLPLGTPVPGFQVTDLAGQTQPGSALVGQGKTTLLIFTSPTCGPCVDLLPEVAGWQREHAARLNVILINRGTAEDVRVKAEEHGLTHVYLQREREVGDLFGVTGTPSAVLVDGAGLIRSPLAGGSVAVRDLVQRSARPLDALRAQLVRPAPIALESDRRPAAALQVGMAMPPVRLADLDGTRVDLATWRGAPLAILFWNPGCGFCRRMLDDLKAWEVTAAGQRVRLVLISTGTVEANRDQGLQTPILLDEGFQIGHAFGARGTPSAVLIDAEGRVATPVVVGASAILEMLQTASVQPTSLPHPAV